MRRATGRRRLAALPVIVVAVSILVATGVLPFATAGAGALAGHAGAVAVTVTPVSRVGDGQAVTIHAQAPHGVVIYQIVAHLCLPGADVRTGYDFGFEGKRCTNAAVGGGDVEKSVEYGSGVTNGTLAGFRIGAGKRQWVDELGYPETITCGPGHPCDLVVELQITDATVFFTAPLCYGGACPADTEAAGGISAATIALAVIAVAVAAAAAWFAITRARVHPLEASSA